MFEWSFSCIHKVCILVVCVYVPLCDSVILEVFLNFLRVCAAVKRRVTAHVTPFTRKWGRSKAKKQKRQGTLALVECLENDKVHSHVLERKKRQWYIHNTLTHTHTQRNTPVDKQETYAKVGHRLLNRRRLYFFIDCIHSVTPGHNFHWGWGEELTLLSTSNSPHILHFQFDSLTKTCLKSVFQSLHKLSTSSISTVP